jgi:hypothetical protein
LPTAVPRAAAASRAEINAQALLLAAAAPGGGVFADAADGESGGTAGVAVPLPVGAVVPPHAVTLRMVTTGASQRSQGVPLSRRVIADVSFRV